MDTIFPWYTLKVTSGKETNVRDWLLKERDFWGIADSFLNAVSPCEKKIVVQGGKKTTKSLLVYSGYVFINADLANETVIEFLKAAPFSWGLVCQRGCGFKGTPVALQENEVAEILNLANNLELGLTSLGENIKFFVGEKVRVIDGPFIDFTGTIHEVYEEGKKLNVMINVFSRSTPVELSFNQVTKL